jgi:hypothetical protein
MREGTATCSLHGYKKTGDRLELRSVEDSLLYVLAYVRKNQSFYRNCETPRQKGAHRMYRSLTNTCVSCATGLFSKPFYAVYLLSEQSRTSCQICVKHIVRHFFADTVESLHWIVATSDILANMSYRIWLDCC